MLRIKLQYDQEVSQEDFIAKSLTFFPKAPLDLKTVALSFWCSISGGLMTWCLCVSTCLHAVKSQDRWVGGMSSLEVLSILTFKNYLSFWTLASLDLVVYLFIFSKYLAFCCFSLLSCQSFFKRGFLSEDIKTSNLWYSRLVTMNWLITWCLLVGLKKQKNNPPPVSVWHLFFSNPFWHDLNKSLKFPFPLLSPFLCVSISFT